MLFQRKLTNKCILCSPCLWEEHGLQKKSVQNQFVFFMFIAYLEKGIIDRILCARPRAIKTKEL